MLVEGRAATCPAQRSSLAFVDIPPMAHMDDDDDEPVVFQRTNQAVVANSIFPELAERPLEFFADGAGIFQVGDTLVQEPEDSVRDGLVELFQFPAGCGVKLNIPGHVAA